MKKLILFAPIAEREVLFYLEFANYARSEKMEVEVQFLSFYQPANKLIEEQGFKVWDLYEYENKTAEFKIAAEQVESFQLPALTEKAAPFDGRGRCCSKAAAA